MRMGLTGFPSWCLVIQLYAWAVDGREDFENMSWASTVLKGFWYSGFWTFWKNLLYCCNFVNERWTFGLSPQSAYTEDGWQSFPLVTTDLFLFLWLLWQSRYWSGSQCCDRAFENPWGSVWSLRWSMMCFHKSDQPWCTAGLLLGWRRGSLRYGDDWGMATGFLFSSLQLIQFHISLLINWIYASISCWGTVTWSSGSLRHESIDIGLKGDGLVLLVNITDSLRIYNV